MAKKKIPQVDNSIEGEVPEKDGEQKILDRQSIEDRRYEKIIAQRDKKRITTFFVGLICVVLLSIISSVVVSCIAIAEEEEFNAYFSEQYISFRVESREMNSLSLWDMQELLEPQEFSAFYHRSGSDNQFSVEKTYTGLLLEDLLYLIYSAEVVTRYNYVKVFSGDGTSTVYEMDYLRKNKTYIAYEVGGRTFNLEDDPTVASSREYGGPFVLIISKQWPGRDDQGNEISNRAPSVYAVALTNSER